MSEGHVVLRERYDDAVRTAAAMQRRAEAAEAAVERVRTLAVECESTGERLHGVPAAQTWLLLSARLHAALEDES